MASRRSLRETPSQTAGPYVHIGLAPGAAGLTAGGDELGRDIAGSGTPGERIRVEGIVRDGAGAPVTDVLIEVWQADADGRHAGPDRGDPPAAGFRGWGRVVPDLRSGEWGFDTVKPGPVPDRHGAPQAPHLTLWLVARGINLGLATRLYFDDEREANARDPLLGTITPARRRNTLIATRTERAAKPALYRFDIALRGDAETVFLAL